MSTSGSKSWVPSGLKFYIWAIPFNTMSGGSVALHKLADTLAKLGEEVYIVADSKNPKWGGIRIDHKDANGLDGVAIYPEIVNGNPFGCKVVVRWLLNTPGIMGGDGLYEPTDLLYKYADVYQYPRSNGILATFNMEGTRRFTNHDEPRKGTCYARRKGSYKTPDKHPDNALCIDDYGSKGGDDYLIKIFNTYETFISYDHATFLSVQAALCGCLPIIIPEEGVSKEEWKMKDLIKGYGMSWGFDDIQWALDTRPLLLPHLEELDRSSIEQCKCMINQCKSVR